MPSFGNGLKQREVLMGNEYTPPRRRKTEPPEPTEELKKTEFQWLMEAVNRLEDKILEQINQSESRLSKRIDKLDERLDSARRFVHIGLGIILCAQFALILLSIFLRR